MNSVNFRGDSNTAPLALGGPALGLLSMLRPNHRPRDRAVSDRITLRKTVAFFLVLTASSIGFSDAESD